MLAISFCVFLTVRSFLQYFLLSNVFHFVTLFILYCEMSQAHTKERSEITNRLYRPPLTCRVPSDRALLWASPGGDNYPDTVPDTPYVPSGFYCGAHHGFPLLASSGLGLCAARATLCFAVLNALARSSDADTRASRSPTLLAAWCRLLFWVMGVWLFPFAFYYNRCSGDCFEMFPSAQSIRLQVEELQCRTFMEANSLPK